MNKKLISIYFLHMNSKTDNQLLKKTIKELNSEIAQLKTTMNLLFVGMVCFSVGTFLYGMYSSDKQ